LKQVEQSLQHVSSLEPKKVFKSIQPGKKIGKRNDQISAEASPLLYVETIMQRGAADIRIAGRYQIYGMDNAVVNRRNGVEFEAKRKGFT
jgi:hypothetical protein